MARVEAAVIFFRCFESFISVRAPQKTRGKPGVSGSFSFTLRERSRMMRMSVHKESLVLRALYTGNQKS